KAHQVPAGLQLGADAPADRSMLYHFGKAAIKTAAFTSWRDHIKSLAEHPTVFCKLTGLVTEADWEAWAVVDLQPYVDTALEYFGPDRLIFGGDWPVVTLASNYMRWYETARELCDALAPADIDKIFHHNALNFYQIREST